MQSWYTLVIHLHCALITRTLLRRMLSHLWVAESLAIHLPSYHETPLLSAGCSLSCDEEIFSLSTGCSLSRREETPSLSAGHSLSCCEKAPLLSTGCSLSHPEKTYSLCTGRSLSHCEKTPSLYAVLSLCLHKETLHEETASPPLNAGLI
jgi:hypothetical protein